MEAGGVGLGTVSLFFQVYDNCRRLYTGYETLRHFGKDMRILLARLKVVEWDLDTLMETKTTEMRHPPDLDNRNHPVTKEILVHLSIILTYFQNCNKVIAATFKASGWVFSEDDGTVSPSAGSSQAPSLVSGGSTQDSADGATTPANSLTAPDPGKRFRFRQAVGRFSPKRLSRSQSRSRSSASSASSLPTSHTETSSATGAQPGAELASLPPVPDIRIEGTPLTALSMQDEESRRLRTEASWWTLVKWADHNKDALEGEINRLTGSVTAFRQYLEIREPRSPGRILAVDSSRAYASYVPRMSPDAVKQLHDALKSINLDPLMNASFSLSIAESCDSNRRAIEDFPGVKGALKPGSTMFFLQKGLNDEESAFVAIEQCDMPEAEQHAAVSLTTTSAITVPGQSRRPGGYTSCGIIGLQDNLSHCHHIFAETQAWRISDTFGDFLDKEQCRRLLTPLALVDIFQTLLTAYLDLEKVRDSCRYPRLEDYKTYMHPEYNNDQNVAAGAADTRWQMPYWSCGLGTPLPRRIPGASREEREPDEAVIRLGIVLFQLGSGSKSILAPGTPGSPKQWRNLKLEALNRLEEVSRVCGLRLANIVEACLRANGRTEKEAVCSCLVSLENLRTELGGNSLA